MFGEGPEEFLVELESVAVAHSDGGHQKAGGTLRLDWDHQVGQKTYRNARHPECRLADEGELLQCDVHGPGTKLPLRHGRLAGGNRAVLDAVLSGVLPLDPLAGDLVLPSEFPSGAIQDGLLAVNVELNPIADETVLFVLEDHVALGHPLSGFDVDLYAIRLKTVAQILHVHKSLADDEFALGVLSEGIRANAGLLTGQADLGRDPAGGGGPLDDGGRGRHQGYQGRRGTPNHLFPREGGGGFAFFWRGLRPPRRPGPNPGQKDPDARPEELFHVEEAFPAPLPIGSRKR